MVNRKGGVIGRHNITDGIYTISFPSLENSIKKFLSTCEHCSKRRTTSIPSPPFRYVVPEYPLQHLYMDLTFLSRDEKEIGLLVIMDHFTKYCWVKTIKDKKASTVAEFLDHLFKTELQLKEIGTEMQDRFIINLRSDNGGEFIGSVVKETCEKYGVRKKEGAPYSPWLQGLVERLNQTLKGKE